MFKLIVEVEKDNFAKLALEPLEVGFGHTIGNSIRRILLSSLEGSAITSVKIDGVSHQFSTIEGISEDVIEIILNIKKVRVKVEGDKPVKLTLKVSGKKSIKAGDIEVEGDGQIINKDAHIATLNDSKAKLNVEMVAERGKGYSKAEERKSDEIGAMAIDALFSPILAINYNVEPTRVGRRTDFDKLILDVTTDGTMTPQEAVEEAARILAATFKQIYEPVIVEEISEEQGKVISDETLKLTVDELDLPVRITNALRAIEVNTVEDLINISRQQLLKAKNLGAKSLILISEKLVERGLNLREA